MIDLAMVLVIQPPPAQFDYEPVYQYQVKTVTPDELLEWCGRLPFNVQLACWNEWSGTIYIRDDLTDDARSHILRHEKGHVNGWAH